MVFPFSPREHPSFGLRVKRVRDAHRDDGNTSLDRKPYSSGLGPVQFSRERARAFRIHHDPFPFPEQGSGFLKRLLASGFTIQWDGAHIGMPEPLERVGEMLLLGEGAGHLVEMLREIIPYEKEVQV